MTTSRPGTDFGFTNRSREGQFDAVTKTMVQRDHPEKLPTLSHLGDNDRTIASSDKDIRGRMVKDKDGLDVGKVEGLLVDDSDSKVRFMEVGSGGFLGLGETKSLIPVDAITKVTADEVYISHTREHVAGAPRYDPDVVHDDSHFFSDLYPYYGFMGYMGTVRPLHDSPPTHKMS